MNRAFARLTEHDRKITRNSLFPHRNGTTFTSLSIFPNAGVWKKESQAALRFNDYYGLSSREREKEKVIIGKLLSRKVWVAFQCVVKASQTTFEHLISLLHAQNILQQHSFWGAPKTHVFWVCLGVAAPAQ